MAVTPTPYPLHPSSMRRTLIAVAIAVAVSFPAVSHAQTGEALIQKVGRGTPVPDPTFPADRSLQYRIAWNVTAAPEKPDGVVGGFRRPANFLTMTDAEGVPRENVHLAIIVYGGAARSLMNDAAYKAANGVANASIPLLEALDGAGVEIIVCGQAIANQKITRDQLLPFVKVATSATMARATLAARGYSTFQE